MKRKSGAIDPGGSVHLLHGLRGESELNNPLAVGLGVKERFWRSSFTGRSPGGFGRREPRFRPTAAA